MSQPIAAAPRSIHLVFKTHLDVGFTDFAANVISNYFNRDIPKAIQLARSLRESGSPDRFIWTTGAWLIYEFLEQASPAAREELEKAIAAGDITWHALPFTTHSENMDVDLFRFGLSLSQQLDRRFGKQTTAAKMTDVPGHTRGIVPLLAEAGVQFLHIGVNAASTPPDVPPVFLWREPETGSEVMVMYHKGSYGDLMIVPGMDEAIAFAHTGDNLGPQSLDDLQKVYQEMRARFPGAEVHASTMDAFAARLQCIRDNLPVIEQEIGDTWIHGAATDPKKEAQYRELLRWRNKALERGATEQELHDFHRKILLVPEHTWGLDLKTHLNDWQNYRPADFQAARKQPNYQKMEASWQEQRGYLHQALEALPTHLRQQAEECLFALEPMQIDHDDYTQITNIAEPLQLQDFGVKIDPQTGALTSLTYQGVEWAGSQNPLGRFWYETFSAGDYARFHRQYNINKRTTSFWSIPDFTKPGLSGIAEEHRIFQPQLTWAGQRSLPGGEAVLLDLQMPEESWQAFGAPQTLQIKLFFPAGQPEVQFDLCWFQKSATRLPEAAWFSFNPLVRDPRRWRMEKLGRWISPFEVIRNGNRHLHAVGTGIRAEGPAHLLAIQPLDSALIAPGQPSLLDFNNRQPDLRDGFHFNLHNNLWGTNFPMWYEEDARFRFWLRIKPI